MGIIPVASDDYRGVSLFGHVGGAARIGFDGVTLVACHVDVATETQAPRLVSGRRVEVAPWTRGVARGQEPERLDPTKKCLCWTDPESAELVPFGISEIRGVECLWSFFAANAWRALIRST
jgi:hypothetical protein